MAVNTRTAGVPAACVWAVLADPDSYATWVVGARDIHGWEGEWPEPGSRFHHSQGAGPIALVHDTTEVLEREPGRRLLLEARMRPWLVFHIDLVLEALGEETTRIVMDERPVRGWLMPLAPAVELSVKARNVEALERLNALAAQRFRGRRAALSEGSPPATSGG